MGKLIVLSMLSDPDGITDMSAEEVLATLFSR